VSERQLLVMTAPVRDRFDIPYHEIGPADAPLTLALVAGTHGDEINGTFVLARLADFLYAVSEGRHAGLSLAGRVVIIPAVNVLGINTRSRAWPFDGTDINRMFPGNIYGETTQRIACAVLDRTRDAATRIDLHSSNQDFEEIPQVRLYDSTEDERRQARLFCLPAVMEHHASPVFTTTLMHAWKIWPGYSFLIQAGHAGCIQLPTCQRVFRSLIAYMLRAGILDGVSLAEEEEDSSYFTRESAVRLHADRAGMFVSDLKVGKWVRRGDEIGYIYDSFSGAVKCKVISPAAGLLTGIRRQPLLFEGDLIVRINRKHAP